MILNCMVSIKLIKYYIEENSIVDGGFTMKDVLIIGAGPAGASAAIFTAKAGKSTVVIDNKKGMTRRAWFENFYGISEISGPALVDTGIEQLKRLGAQLVEDTVVKLEVIENGIRATTESGEVVDAQHVIIASGIHTSLTEALQIETAEGTEPRIKTIIKVDAQGKTNINRVWAAGTIAGVSVHAIITAGDGAKVAINVISELNGERYVDHDVFSG